MNFPKIGRGFFAEPLPLPNGSAGEFVDTVSQLEIRRGRFAPEKTLSLKGLNDSENSALGNAEVAGELGDSPGGLQRGKATQDIACFVQGSGKFPRSRGSLFWIFEHSSRNGPSICSSRQVVKAGPRCLNIRLNFRIRNRKKDHSRIRPRTDQPRAETQRSPSDGRGQSSRAKCEALRKISPGVYPELGRRGRNDKPCHFADLASWRDKLC
jgi:hypothetical protein